jgi:DNA-binding response OmpR family regulator
MDKKILLVEDEQALVDIMAEKLRAEGFEVATAGDGEAGLKKALEWNPDVVLLDVMMPKMDGLTMLKELRKHDELHKIQIIMLTNVSDSDKVNEAMKYGVFDFLVKSNWEIDDLVKEVRAKVSVPH